MRITRPSTRSVVAITILGLAPTMAVASAQAATRPATSQRSVVSSSASGQRADTDVTGPVLSPDGARVAFLSAASNLVPGGQTTGIGHLYVKDLSTGAISVADSTAGGMPGNSGTNLFWSFAPSGTQLLFWSEATNLLAAPTPSGGFYVKNLLDGSIRLISSLPNGTPLRLQHAREVNQVAAFIDPTHVAFAAVVTTQAAAPGLPAHVAESFVKNLSTGALTVVSSAADGTPADDDVFGQLPVPSSPDVVFASKATNLVPGVSGDQIYLKDTVTGAIRVLSSTSAGVTGSADAGPLAVSPDGRQVAFISSAPGFPGARPHQPEYYVKDLMSGALTLVSSTTNGISARGPGYIDAPVLIFAPDSRTVAFDMQAGNLARGTSWIAVRTYVKNLTTGQLTLPRPPGGRATNSLAVQFSPDGRHLLFQAQAGGAKPYLRIFEDDLASGAVRSVAPLGALESGYQTLDRFGYVDDHDVLALTDNPARPYDPTTNPVEIYRVHVDR